MENKLIKAIDAHVFGYVGRGVAEARIDGSGHLIFTMTDGSELDLGRVTGSGGGNLIVIDPTLSIAGQAADAAETGKVKNIALYASQRADDAEQLASEADRAAKLALESVGSMGELATADQTSLVAAINETMGETYKKLPIAGGTLTGVLKTKNPIEFIGANGEGVYIVGHRDTNGTSLVQLAGTYNDEFVILKGVAAPREDNDAVNKGYVDSMFGAYITDIDTLIGGDG